MSSTDSKSIFSGTYLFWNFYLKGLGINIISIKPKTLTNVKHV